MTVPTSVRIPNFTPSVNGLHFPNSFPHEPDLEISIPIIGKVPVGDASNGVCGGMVYTVRDVFQTKGMAPIAATEPPAPDSALFGYIVDRLIDSFQLPFGVLQYYEWMLHPDGDQEWTSLIKRRGLAWKTIKEEWPRHIRPALKAGRLCCLGLITMATADPRQLGNNHQVMAYGYDLDADDTLTLHVYDPNTSPAQADNVYIKLSLKDPEHAARIEHNVAIAHPIRGFFRVKYHYRNPKARLG